MFEIFCEIFVKIFEKSWCYFTRVIRSNLSKISHRIEDDSIFFLLFFFLQTDQQSVPDQIHSSTPNSNAKSDKATATLIRHLLTENKQMNSKLRKIKEELLFVCELCSRCPTCVKEKKLKKASMSSLRQRSAASTSEVNDLQKHHVRPPSRIK